MSKIYIFCAHLRLDQSFCWIKLHHPKKKDENLTLHSLHKCVPTKILPGLTVGGLMTNDGHGPLLMMAHGS